MDEEMKKRFNAAYYRHCKRGIHGDQLTDEEVNAYLALADVDGKFSVDKDKATDVGLDKF